MDFPNRIPAVLQPILQEYRERLEQEIPGLVSAVYLVGSIALDGFNPRLSDIDYVAVLSRRASPQDQQKLLTLHQAIARRHRQWQLEGMYFQACDLGRVDPGMGSYLNYHDGKLSEFSDAKLHDITWWILKNRGIAVFGPDPQSLPIPIDMENLLQKQLDNLHAYWASWVKAPIRRLALLTDWGVQWTVLGVLRQFYTLRERQVTTKTGAGEYALACLPEHWHPLIREAIALRESPRRSAYWSRIKRARETYGLIKYILQVCNGS